jgi:hypothetical protein
VAKAKQIEDTALLEQTVELPTVEQNDDNAKSIESTDEMTNKSTDESLNEVPKGTPYSDMSASKIREEYTRITGLVPADDLPLSAMIQVMFNNFMLEQQMGYQMEVMQDQIARGVFTA